jgi:sulfonate transport system ATP-binding protein
VATLVPRGVTRAGVRLRGVSRSFDDRAVLRGVDLDIGPGEFVALLGASGTGKSTLLRIVAGLDTDADGAVDVPTARAVVYQEHRLLPWHEVWRNVAIGLPRAGARDRAVAALAEVGLEARADAWPLTLSGGEAQRAAVARALVRAPDLLLLDEPFASVDALTRLKVQGLVAALWERHRPAVLLVTHDVTEALALADRALVLAGGTIAHEMTVDLPRPRNVDTPRFAALRRELLAHLGVEQPDRPTVRSYEPSELSATPERNVRDEDR